MREGGTTMERLLTIGELARATSVPAKTIRYGVPWGDKPRHNIIYSRAHGSRPDVAMDRGRLIV